jgi:hypothetical protein
MFELLLLNADMTIQITMTPVVAPPEIKKDPIYDPGTIPSSQL